MKEILGQAIIKTSKSYYEHYLRCKELCEKAETLNEEMQEIEEKQATEKKFAEAIQLIASDEFFKLIKDSTEETKTNFEEIRKNATLEYELKTGYLERQKELKKQLKKVDQEFEIHKTLAQNDLETAIDLMSFAKEEPICLTPKGKDVKKVEAFLYIYFAGDVRWRFINSNRIDEKSTLSKTFMKLYKERKQQTIEAVAKKVCEKARKYEI